jgi:hypothetical protein
MKNWIIEKEIEMVWHQEILMILKEYQLAGPLVSAVVAAIVAYSIVYINYKLQSNPVGIAIISKNGNLLYKYNFNKYEIQPEIQYEEDEKPYYIVTFKTEPDYFEVHAQDAVIREINQLKIGKYKITFFKLLPGGWFSPTSETIECDFRIQAYKIK